MRYCNLKIRSNRATIGEIDTLYMCHSNFIVLLPHINISPWTQILIQAFIVAYQNLTFKSVKQNCCFRNQH